jgi:hypothetical protein
MYCGGYPPVTSTLTFLTTCIRTDSTRRHASDCRSLIDFPTPVGRTLAWVVAWILYGFGKRECAMLTAGGGSAASFEAVVEVAVTAVVGAAAMAVGG